MTISEMLPYISGDLYTRECAAPCRCNINMYSKVVRQAAASSTYSKSIMVSETVSDFMYLEPDIANVFPISEREELFFCLKNGGFSPDVPAKCIFILKTLMDVYGSATLAFKALNANTFRIFFQKNYLNDCTMRDVVKNFIDPDYEPISESRVRLRHETYDEIYISDTDMVALLPKDLSNKLSDKDITQIRKGQNGLEIDGLLLRFMGGYYGACNSIYDLRKLV